MQLTSLDIENFTSFRDRQTFGPLGPLSAIIGPNNVGKSNVFEALRLLTDSTSRMGNLGDIGSSVSIFFDGDMSRPVRLSAHCAFTQEEWDSVPRIGNLPEPNEPVLEHEFGLTVAYERSLKITRFLDGIDSDRQVARDAVTPNLRTLWQGSVMHVPSQRRLDPEQVGRTAWSVQEPFDGRALKVWLQEFYAARTASGQSRLAQFKADLQSVAGFEELDFMPSVAATGEHEILVGTPGHFRSRLEECGAGVQAVFIILAALYQTPPRIVLVDDVEAALHPAAQATFAATLAARVGGSGGQVIFATHSPSVLEAVPTDQIFELRREDAHAVVRPPNAERTHVLDSLWELGYRPSMLQMAEVVLFVEGPSDEAAVRAWWRTLFGDTPEPTVALVSLGGSNYEHLARSSLQALGRQVVVMLDSDREREGAELKPKLAAFMDEMCDVAHVHVLERRELENYFTPGAVMRAMSLEQEPAVEPFRRFVEAVPSYGKMTFAGRIAAEMKAEEIPCEITLLLQQVRAWSGRKAG